MELLREKTQMQISDAELEAQKHNAMISERYKRLQNAVANQLAEDVHTEERGFETVNEGVRETSNLYISPNTTANTTTYAQNPTVTEYISRASTALFGTEKFDRMQPAQAEQAIATPVEIAAPVKVEAVKMEAQYSLTPMAKIAMAVFTFVIVAMLTLICVNTYNINQKRIRIQNLEEKKEQLIEQSEEIQRRIENATSEETIREYAESQGMVQSGN